MNRLIGAALLALTLASPATAADWRSCATDIACEQAVFDACEAGDDEACEVAEDIEADIEEAERCETDVVDCDAGEKA